MTPDTFLAYIRQRVTNNKDAAELVALLLAQEVVNLVAMGDAFRLEDGGKKLQAIVDELETQRSAEPDDSEGIPF